MEIKKRKKTKLVVAIRVNWNNETKDIKHRIENILSKEWKQCKREDTYRGL